MSPGDGLKPFVVVKGHLRVLAGVGQSWAGGLGGGRLLAGLTHQCDGYRLAQSPCHRAGPLCECLFFQGLGKENMNL